MQWDVFCHFFLLIAGRHENYLTGHKISWANTFNQQKEFEAMLCCTPMLSVNVCWVPQDQLCFSVTHWPCASKGCRVALGIYLSQHNVQLGILSQNKTGLFFYLGSDPEEVTPTISEPLGGCVSYLTCPKSTTRPA